MTNFGRFCVRRIEAGRFLALFLTVSEGAGDRSLTSAHSFAEADGDFVSRWSERCSRCCHEGEVVG